MGRADVSNWTAATIRSLLRRVEALESRHAFKWRVDAPTFVPGAAAHADPQYPGHHKHHVVPDCDRDEHYDHQGNLHCDYDLPGAAAHAKVFLDGPQDPGHYKHHVVLLDSDRAEHELLRYHSDGPCDYHEEPQHEQHYHHECDFHMPVGDGNCDYHDEPQHKQHFHHECDSHMPVGAPPAADPINPNTATVRSCLHDSRLRVLDEHTAGKRTWLDMNDLAMLVDVSRKHSDIAIDLFHAFYPDVRSECDSGSA